MYFLEKTINSYIILKYNNDFGWVNRGEWWIIIIIISAEIYLTKIN